MISVTFLFRNQSSSLKHIKYVYSKMFVMCLVISMQIFQMVLYFSSSYEKLVVVLL